MFEEIASEILNLFLVFGFMYWALKSKEWFIELIACPVLITYGLTTAGSLDPYTPAWVACVSVAILGMFFLYKVASMAAVYIKAKSGGKNED